MKRFLFAVSLVVSLIFCTMCDSGHYLYVKGVIDPSYDGYNVYFRPQPFPTAEIVDSCRIENGSFSFKLPADSLFVGDIVLSFSSSKRVEPLLVAVEPGTLTVDMGLESHASGTPLNDTLAAWKKFIEENVQGRRNQELLHAEDVFTERTVQLIKNQPNALGGYLFFLFSPTFDAETITELDSLKIYQYMPDVKNRPIKFNKK